MSTAAMTVTHPRTAHGLERDYCQCEHECQVSAPRDPNAFESIAPMQQQSAPQK